MKTIRLFFLLAGLLVSWASLGQNTISGIVLDEQTGEPLIGASVIIQGTSIGTSTDMNGKFSFSTSIGKGILEISFLSFKTKTVSFGGGKNHFRVTLTPDAESLSEVVVTGNSLIDIAKERETPVAVSTVKSVEIVEKLGNKEFPEILNRTPSIYATKAGGGFGDSKISVRGFGNENVAVMVNGMPVNDMENGKVYWSNWAGISDVTSVLQVQRGLGASKIAIASIGGTINIVSRSSDMKEGGSLSGTVGNDGFHKVNFSYNTGKNAKGWSSSVLLGRTAGSTYADMTSFEGYTYFFALGYQPNNKHNFQFMITGAPQWHNQRSTSVSIADAIKYGGSADKPNRRYNADWGYLNGEEFSIRRNVYHKPILTLNWDWTINDRSSLNTVLYASFGRGFGTGDNGGSIRMKDNNGNYIKDASGKEKLFKLYNFRNDNGLYDFDKVYAENPLSKTPIVRRASVNSHNWYGVLSNFNHKINDNLSFSVGVDGRYYYGYHYQSITDFIGAPSVSDSSNKNLTSPNIISHTISSYPSFNPFKKVEDISDRYGYSNDGEVNWIGTFGQVEYKNDDFSTFVQASLSNQGFNRIDNFLKPGTLAVRTDPSSAMEKETGFKNIVGYNVKGGANYNINENHNVFANVGYYSRQPFLNVVYPNNKNYLNPNLKNEGVIGIEAGYGLTLDKFNAIVNVYQTTWKDRSLRRPNNITLPNNAGTIYAYANIEGIKEVHQGVELEANYIPTDFLKFNGSLSLGNWSYKGDAQGTLFNESNQMIDFSGNPTSSASYVKLFLDGVKVGDSAQQTASLGATLKPFEGFKFNVDWRYVNNLYANLNISDFNDEATAKKGALKLPSYNLFDTGISYKWNILEKQSITFALNIDNLFDTYYILESYGSIHASDKPKGSSQTYQELGQTYKGIATANQVYFGFGRTWNLSLRYNF